MKSWILIIEQTVMLLPLFSHKHFSLDNIHLSRWTVSPHSSAQANQ